MSPAFAVFPVSQCLNSCLISLKIGETELFITGSTAARRLKASSIAIPLLSSSWMGAVG